MIKVDAVFEIQEAFIAFRVLIIWENIFEKVQRKHDLAVLNKMLVDMFLTDML